MKLRLEITAPGVDAHFDHAGPAVRIGRDPRSELPVQGEQVSWRHARLDLTAHGARLTDLGSTNGTFVNDRRVTTGAPVQVGDVIGLGATGPRLVVLELDLTEAEVECVRATPEGRPSATALRAASAPPVAVLTPAGTEEGVKEALTRTRRWPGVALATTAVVVLVAAGGYLLYRGGSGDTTSPDTGPTVLARQAYADHQVELVQVNERQSRGLTFDADEYPPGAVFSQTVAAELRPGANEVLLVEKNSFEQERAVQLWLGLRPASPPGQGLPKVKLTAVVNGTALAFDSIAPRGEALETETQAVTLAAGRRNVIRVRVENEGPGKADVKLQVSWRDDPTRVDLYVLALGISRYRQPGLKLSYAHRDAEELLTAFRTQQGKLFHKVHAALLCDGQATASAISAKLKWLRDTPREHDLAIITYAGHGDKHPASEQFYLLPSDFDPGPPDSPRELMATGALSWGNVWEDYLSRMKCRVVVIMDACHSGAITLPGLRKTPGRTGFDRGGVEGALRKFTQTRQKRGVVLIAACMKDQVAYEKAALGHGALTRAVLDCMREPRSEVLTLAGLLHYVQDRVPQLAGADQAVVVTQTGNVSYPHIPISVPPAPR
ncbi:MAG: caspase family protein [Gemmataceae bacterium]|nr:caspase family protein [Gemmataceae bacterium]